MDGWDAEETLRLIEEHGITHTHMVPTMFHRLLVAARRRARRATTSRRCARPARRGAVPGRGEAGA